MSRSYARRPPSAGGLTRTTMHIAITRSLTIKMVVVVGALKMVTWWSAVESISKQLDRIYQAAKSEKGTVLWDHLHEVVMAARVMEAHLGVSIHHKIDEGHIRVTCIGRPGWRIYT